MSPGRLFLAASLVALLATACGDGGGSGARAGGEEPGSGAGAAPPNPSVSAPAVEDTACPATGRWAQCSLLKRLERAGLVVQVDSGAAREAPLTRDGIMLRVGSAELEVFFYPDANLREREQRLLDATRYVTYAGSQTFRAEPTLIGNANLIAILHSNNSKQRERVGDAITAGPPQPIP